MFKRILSLVLCFVICIGCFSCVTASAVYSAKSIFAVTSAPVKDNLLRYTINVTSQQKGIAGIVLAVNFDSTVLKPILCEPATTTTEGNGTKKNFEGTYVHGITENDENLYSIAYMNTVAVSTNAAAKPFFNMVFEVIDSSRPKTDVSFYCKEYYSVSETDKNITVEDGLQEIALYQNIATLEAPALTSLNPILEGFTINWKSVVGADGYAIYRSTPSAARTLVGEVSGANNTTYQDIGLVSGETYTYTVTAINRFGESTFDSVVLSRKFIAKPTIDYVKNVVGGVEIRWNKTEGAEWYNIMRRVKGEADFKKIATRVGNLDTFYKDTTAKDGVEYEYDINSATDTFESITASSGTSILYIKAPTISSITNTLNGIELKWTAHPKATSYVIYKKAIGVDTELKEYAQVNATSFVDTSVEAGKAYTYSIKACTNQGDSAYNITGYTITCVPSTVVTGFEADKVSLTVSWAKVEGADGYHIYRKEGSNAWVKVGTVSKDKLSYEDKTLSGGTQYIYAVTPIIANSEGAKIASDPVYFIKAPTDVVATNEKAGIQLKWRSVSGAVTYNVYRREANGNMIQIATATENAYLDANVSFNSTYTYSVVAINPKGSSKDSIESNSLIRLAAIGKTTLSIGEGGIKIEWAPSSIAESYALYRYNGSQWLMLDKVNGTSYIDKNVVSNQTYAYAIAAIKGTSIGILNTDNPMFLRYIAPVKDIKTANGVNFTRISWNAVEGATSYYLYKSSTENGEYKLIATLKAEQLKYDDKNISAGAEYFYKVRCHNGESYSEISVAKRNVFLERSAIKSITNSYGGQTIKWSGVEGATGYNIYRKQYTDKSYTFVTTVDAKTLSFLEKNAVNGAIMTYAVRAVNGDSIGGFKARSYTYVAAPEVTVTNTVGGIVVKWAKNDVATSYNVYRKVNGAKSWRKIANIQGTTYTDKNIKSGNTYTYTVKAYKGKYLSGCNSSGWSTIRLDAPKIKSVANSYGSLKVSWNAIGGAKTYYIYRKADGEKSWTKIGQTANTYFYDKNVQNRNVYKYTVRAVNGKSISSYYSSGKSGRYIQAPKLTVQNSTNGIYINWNRIAGANSYYLYRKAGNAKSWTKIDTVTGNSYLDTNVKEGVVYKYTIRAYGSKALSGYYSKGWATMHLKTPELNSARVYGSGIQVKWSKISYATSYYVYRKEKGDKSWTKIATVKGTSYIDRNVEYDDTYTYTVRAVNGSYKSFYKSTGISCRFR